MDGISPGSLAVNQPVRLSPVRQRQMRAIYSVVVVISKLDPDKKRPDRIDILYKHMHPRHWPSELQYLYNACRWKTQNLAVDGEAPAMYCKLLLISQQMWCILIGLFCHWLTQPILLKVSLFAPFPRWIVPIKMIKLSEASPEWLSGLIPV